MKKNKIILIFIVAILVLSAVFITKFYVNKKTNIENNEKSEDISKILEKDMWLMTKIDYYYNNNLETLNDTSTSFTFEDGNVKICEAEKCYDTKYTLKNNIISIEEKDESSFSGEFGINYENEQLILKVTKDNNYVKFYLSHPEG